MADADAFDEWLSQFAYLSDAETLGRPDWQQRIAFIHQFALNSMGDGAGSLFYNHTENIDNVADAFDAIGESDLSQTIRRISEILEPFVEEGPPDMQDILIEQCLHGAATSAIEDLDALLASRWDALYAKLEGEAKARGWTA